MLTPYSIVMAARTVLAVMVPLAMLVVFVCSAQPVLVEGLFFLLVSLVCAQMAIMALPWSRRNDTIKTVVLVSVVTAAVRSGLTGEPSFVVTVPAALIGVVAVWLTLEIEYCRKLARNYGDTSFAIIAIETERRRRKKAQAEKNKALTDRESASDSAKIG